MFIQTRSSAPKLYLPNLDGKHKRFVTKIWKKWLPTSNQTDYRTVYRSIHQFSFHYLSTISIRTKEGGEEVVIY